MRGFRKQKNVLFFYISGILLFSFVVYLISTGDHVVTTNHDFEYFATEKPYKYSDFKKVNARGAGNEHIVHPEGHHSQAIRQRKTLDSVDETYGNYVEDKAGTFNEKSLKAYVVEEHHEVVPYWFGAANQGTITREGNILVHIDGHSDTSSLFYVPGYPFFKWPSKEQLSYLMQMNDAFIQASSMTGLVDRMIWVWPTWDENNHLNPHVGGSYVTYKIHLGWMDVSNETLAPTDIAFCMCTEDNGTFTCFTNTEIQSESVQDIFYYVNRNRCRTLRILIIEELSEQFSITYFKDFEWNSENRSVILDIDEDFYGCSYAVDPLIRASVDLERVEKIDEAIQKMFCPVNSVQDAESDKFLVHILSEIAKIDQCKRGVLKRSVKCRKYIKDKISTFSQKLTFLIKQELIKLCQPNFNIEELIKTFLRQVDNFSTDQILALTEVGFCANTTPKTLDIFGWRKFGICMGANTPNHSAILEHTPSKKEVDSRSIILKGMLKLVKPNVNLVTIARSVRDGYTPRKYFEQIEQDVISNLREAIDKNMLVVYDEDLLGGRKGWGSRNRH